MLYSVIPWSYLLPALLVRVLRDGEGVIGVEQSASDRKALADLLLLSEGAGPTRFDGHCRYPKSEACVDSAGPHRQWRRSARI